MYQPNGKGGNNMKHKRQYFTKAITFDLSPIFGYPESDVRQYETNEERKQTENRENIDFKP